MTTLTNLERVLWPEAGFTKGDLIGWYRDVAPALLPHLRSRPLTLWRYPSGVHERGFWQNECRGAPEWMRVEQVREQRFCVVDDARSLEWVANLGTIELHPFGWRIESPDVADTLVLDLDPGPPATLRECCEVALLLHDRLGARALVKTSGGAGLHLVAPAAEPFAATKARARALADELAAERPDLVVATQSRASRRGRVLVDWLQNDATRSTVAAYSLRARPLPTVSTPLAWEEVEAGDPDRLVFGPRRVLERLDRLGDLFAPIVRP
jgi:bifunctional non-homologous end joining protein LigD